MGLVWMLSHAQVSSLRQAELVHDAASPCCCFLPYGTDTQSLLKDHDSTRKRSALSGLSAGYGLDSLCCGRGPGQQCNFAQPVCYKVH